MFLLRLFVSLLLLASVLCASSAFAAPVLRFYGEEIVVTASRLPQELDRSPWSVTVIRADEARTIGAETVADVLRIVPGADIYSVGGRGALDTIRLHGANSSQVLVLLDGCRINSPLLGSVDLGDIMLADVEKIEIVTMPLSAVYGSDAISGVINVITKKTAKKSPFDLSVGLGSFGEQKGNIAFGNDSYIISFDYNKTNGFRTNSDYLGQAIDYSQVFETGAGDFQLGANYYNADKGVPGVPDDPNQPTSASTPGNRQKDRNLNVYLGHEKDLGGSNLSTKVYCYSTEQQFHEYNFYTLTFADTTYKTNQTGLNLQNTVAFSENATVNMGLEYRSEDGTSDFIGSRQISDLAIYMDDEVRQGPITLSVGVRADSHSIAGDSVNPRVGLSLKPSPDLKFWGNIATAYKAPTLNDLYWNDPIYQMYGNVNLKPERSVGIEMGVNKHFGEGSVLGLILFARKVDEQILWETDYSTFITNAKNVGKVENTGIEAKYNATLSEWVDLFANATYQTAINKEDVTAANIGKELPYSPSTKYNYGINIKTLLGNFAILTKHVGDRYADVANTLELADYGVTDLNYTKGFGQVNIFAGANNIFNTVYYEAVGWEPPPTYTIRNYPMPGRNFSFGASYQM
ncbi:MAG: TonB-dependent receptor [Candidatus Margulisbacteria bacterium]|nr:TonB-dependent receptor [Candidatus Margulisiibacteriota bacterium]